MDNSLAYEILNRIGQLDESIKQLDQKFSLQLDEKTNQLDQKFSSQLDEHRKECMKKFNEYDQHFIEIDKTLKELQRSILIIEDDTHNKIPALFDANKVREEKDEELQTEINDLAESSELHSIKISILEDTSKKHSEQLAHLLS